MPGENGRKPLVRKGEPTQKTDQGVEIPLPKRKSVMDLLNKAATKRKPSRSEKGKRRTARDDQ
jgi:hypothetical protein